MQFATDLMVFLPYTPRADSASRGYEQWLVDIDNPFFNRVPGILHYSNWRVTNSAPGHFTHFDFMYLDPALADSVWTNPEVIAFAGSWTDQWGIDPQSADLSVNYNSYRLRLRSGQSMFDPSAVRITGSTSDAARFGGAVWAVEAPMVGTSPAPFYEFAFGASGSEPVDSQSGTLVAAPGQ
jgi:hypothetical protein